jgi:hypothetical protein
MTSRLQRELFVPRRVRHQHADVIAREAILHDGVHRCLSRNLALKKSCH